jgi:DNA mismatch repair ATPase MutS
MLRGWIERPLLSPVKIARRQQAVCDLVEDIVIREELSAVLREVTDLERLIGRVVYGSAGGRDLVALANGLGKLPRIRALLEGCSSALLGQLREGLDDLPDLRELLTAALVGATPLPKTLWQRFAATRAGRYVSVAAEPLFVLAMLLIGTAYLVDGSFNPFLYFRF